jgi:amino acid permease
LRDVGLGFHGQAIGAFYWYHPGATHNGWYGFCSVIIIAAFAYSGSEVVGLTAAEQEDPKRDMPRAIKKVFWRIGLVSPKLYTILSPQLINLLVLHRLDLSHRPSGSVQSSPTYQPSATIRYEGIALRHRSDKLWCKRLTIGIQ